MWTSLSTNTLTATQQSMCRQSPLLSLCWLSDVQQSDDVTQIDMSKNNLVWTEPDTYTMTSVVYVDKFVDQCTHGDATEYVQTAPYFFCVGSWTSNGLMM